MNTMYTKQKLYYFFYFFLLWSGISLADVISTNEASFSNPPTWLTESQVNRVVENIQKYMEWDIRKVSVKWYYDQQEFQNFHHYDATVMAVSRKSDSSIHIGPRVNKTNFDQI